ncbi:Crp/Fnr family transcriptional regulator [Secundilactobacillus yichangensis]|uniref:Crp/Fnr family transcriptional regulator n=1 Tax=Secundilactobacillus yichangensis TaxID=2799580 RepID=UPI0019446A95|nr:Crp/Fnr family transcriptional regulator [Secundilactobacillus yichangensis]
MLEHHDAIACVKLVPIFQQLDHETVSAVADLVQERHVKKGEFVFMAGDHADSLIIMAHGQVKVTQSSASGREQLIRLLQTGDFDGESVLFEDTERQTSAEALTDTQICLITREDFQKLIKQSPTVAINMLNALGKRVSELEAQAAATLTTSVGERLANYLVETSSELDTDDFDLPLQKKDLALYLGTSPETISRKLKQFSTSGLISQRGRNHIKLNDIDGLMMVEN